MSGELWLEWVMILLACSGSALVSFWLLVPRSIGSKGNKAGHPSAQGADTEAVFLFDDDVLIDSTDAGRLFLPADESRVDWQTLRDAVVSDYPDFPSDPDEVRANGTLFVPAASGATTGGIVCELVDGAIRVQLQVQEPPVQPLALQKPERELEFLRDTLDAAPYPIWRIGDTGSITWTNAAYARLARRLRGSETDVNSAIFPDIIPEKKPGRKSRVSIAAGAHGNRLWYDVSVVRQTGGNLCFAVDINAVVDAEVAQRNFVQTLAKTFAQLSIGLAIFDRNRQLALFNPALVDLTALPADFLSARPNLLSFFDRLRDGKMMPEPKNYNSWRDQMADLVAAAADGRYQETWSLPSGSVYSVSGRPHPDGAVAFLFEDITAEITLTRRFRSELEMGQAVLDQLTDAIAVFSPDGTLSFSNVAYNALWDSDPDRSFAQVTILDTTRIWQTRCQASPAWGEIRDFVAARENRVEWWIDVRLRDGRKLTCNVHPIQSGATMIRFSGMASQTELSANAPQTDRSAIKEPDTERIGS